MKANDFFKLGTAAVLAMFLASCSSSGSEDDSDMDGSASTVMDNSSSNASSSAVVTTPQLSAQELREQERESAMLRQTVFYFEFDESELSVEAREALVYHANRLKANPNMSVRIEGHADERGTREYNLALGERRAQAVERYLQVQGVSSRQLETISYGEESPVAIGSSDAAYSRNRRVELKF